MHHGYRPGSLSSLRAVGVCPMSLNCAQLFKLTALEPRFFRCFHSSNITVYAPRGLKAQGGKTRLALGHASVFADRRSHVFRLARRLRTLYVQPGTALHARTRHAKRYCELDRLLPRDPILHNFRQLLLMIQIVLDAGAVRCSCGE